MRFTHTLALALATVALAAPASRAVALSGSSFVGPTGFTTQMVPMTHYDYETGKTVTVYSPITVPTFNTMTFMPLSAPTVTATATETTTPTSVATVPMVLTEPGVPITPTVPGGWGYDTPPTKHVVYTGVELSKPQVHPAVPEVFADDDSLLYTTTLTTNGALSSTEPGDVFTVTADASVPEPGTLGVLGAVAAGLLARRARRTPRGHSTSR